MRRLTKNDGRAQPRGDFLAPKKNASNADRRQQKAICRSQHLRRRKMSNAPTMALTTTTTTTTATTSLSHRRRLRPASTMRLQLPLQLLLVVSLLQKASGFVQPLPAAGGGGMVQQQGQHQKQSLLVSRSTLQENQVTTHYHSPAATTTTEQRRPSEPFKPVASVTSSSSSSQFIHSFDSPLAMLGCIQQAKQNAATTDTTATDTSTPEFMVIQYYASYCKRCQRAGLVYKKIASDHSNTDNNNHRLQFYRFKADKLPASTLKSLGVTKFPFFQVFRKGECVASFSGGTNLNKAVRSTLDLVLSRTDQQWAAFLTEVETFVHKNSESRHQVQQHLLLQQQQKELEEESCTTMVAEESSSDKSAVVAVAQVDSSSVSSLRP